jgi:hypothetical protein
MPARKYFFSAQKVPKGKKAKMKRSKHFLSGHFSSNRK